MNKIKTALSRFIKDESGQGMTEYILLLVVVLGIVFLFGGNIRDIISEKMGSIGGEVNSFSSDNFK